MLFATGVLYLDKYCLHISYDTHNSNCESAHTIKATRLLCMDVLYVEFQDWFEAMDTQERKSRHKIQAPNMNKIMRT